MNTQERNALIAEYGMGWVKLIAQLDQTPSELWQFKPSPQDWSVHEIIIHLADSESNSFLRCRQAVAQLGEAIMGYDQDAWATNLDYHARNTDDALALLRLVRKMTYDFIKTLPAATWANTYFHPESQSQVTLDRWLTIYAAHIPEHIAQIQGNVKAWQAIHKKPALPTPDP